MAKKRTPKMQTTQDEKTQMAVRLELPIGDYQRLERQAKALGLTKASYARMAVMKSLKADEEKEK
jgi:hypothetical protein